MKILYAVQATGNGHISRAHEVFPYLAELGEVHIFLSGANSALELKLPVKFRSKGCSLYYTKTGGIHYLKTFGAYDISRIKREAAELPVEKYDLIINDFEHITSQACIKKKKESIQFGHQASFSSVKAPRPEKKSFTGEYVLKNYAPCTHYLGLHFEKYDSFIFPPVIKNHFLHVRPHDHGHLTVYLPAFNADYICSVLQNFLPNVQIHIFNRSFQTPQQKGNITFFPVNMDYFNNSLIHCHAILTGAGFETPAEALYLKKKLIVVPISGQYEQLCNAAALSKLGVPVVKKFNMENGKIISEWFNSPCDPIKMEANHIPDTIQYLLSLNLLNSIPG
jgi:uncharacterized protein (TIGR00661 family)